MKTKTTQVRALGFRMLAAAALAVPTLAQAQEATTITSDLSTAATTAITGVLTAMGAILVAAFAIPVGKKVYRVIKGAIGSA